jgi:hypothetical protein
MTTGVRTLRTFELNTETFPIALYGEFYENT